MQKEKTIKSYEMDMCNGPLIGKILVFTIPLMLSGILQLLFNAVNMIVVGRFIGSNALAAVGSTGPLVNLLVNVFMGLSVGASVLVGHYYGAGQETDVEETVHTAILLSLVSGIFLLFVGLFLTRPLLVLMGTPADVINESVLYLRIYFCGMPVMLLYNFGSSILRAIGDTKRPLYFLLAAGVVNIILNLFFVIIVGMDVAGAALATDISQCISAGLIIRCLMRQENCCRLDLKKLRINRDKLGRIARIGLPAGVQGSLFSISNVLIQSSINSFGSIAMAGNSATSNLEGFIYTSMNSFYQTSLNFTSQNVGGKRYDRIKKILVICLCSVTVVGLGMGLLGQLFGTQLLGIYSTDTHVIAFGLERMHIIFSVYFLCGIMEVVVGSLRGLGYSIMPMIVSLLGACGFRILWIFTVFQWSRSLPTLYVSYPVSWFITFSIHLICFLIIYKKFMHKQLSAKVSNL